MRLVGLLMVAVVASALGSCGGRSGAKTFVRIDGHSLDRPFGRVSFSFSCDPPRGNVPLPDQACAAVEASPDLVEHPSSNGIGTCGGVVSRLWHLAISGRVRGKQFHSSISTCWTFQTPLIAKLPLPDPYKHLLTAAAPAAQPSSRLLIHACRPADLTPTLISEGDMTGVVIVAKFSAKIPCLLAGRVGLTIQQQGRSAAIRGNPLMRSLRLGIRKAPRPVLHGRWENWCRGGTRDMTLRLAYGNARESASLRVAPACIDVRAASKLFALPIYPDYP